jgi:hypothetical protein
VTYAHFMSALAIAGGVMCFAGIVKRPDRTSWIAGTFGIACAALAVVIFT